MASADPIALPTISVVIPTLNAERWIGGALDALAGQEYGTDWEVVVADNGCTDGTLDVVRSWEGRLPVRVVDASRARGVSVARNEGAFSSRMDAVAFCDADDEVGPVWLHAAGAGLLEYDGVCGPLDEVALNPGAVRGWRSHTPDRLPSGWGWFPFLHGGNCAIRAEAFRSIGGYDESYRLGGDDVELSWRLQLAGHRIGFQPEMVVRYRHRASIRVFARQQFHFGRQDVRLYRDFAPRGLPREPAAAVARAWAKVVVYGLRSIIDRDLRGRWVGLLARRTGRLVGMVQFRRLYP